VFEPYPDQARVYCYQIAREDLEVNESGRSKIAVGRARITSEITLESDVLSFGALYMGDHTMNAGVRVSRGEESYQTLKEELAEPFMRADFTQVIRILDRHFGESTYSLRSIFRDDQRKILNIILKSALGDAESAYRQLYEAHAPMMRFLADLHAPLPKAFKTAAEFAINSSLREAFEEVEALDLARIHSLIEEARLHKVSLDGATLGFALRKTVQSLSERLIENPWDVQLMQKMETAAVLARKLPFDVDVSKAQNNYYYMLENIFPQATERARQDDAGAKEWLGHFIRIGQNLAVRVEWPGELDLLLKVS
jgi:hypothetical protein